MFGKNKIVITSWHIEFLPYGDHTPSLRLSMEFGLPGGAQSRADAFLCRKEPGEVVLPSNQKSPTATRPRGRPGTH